MDDKVKEAVGKWIDEHPNEVAKAYLIRPKMMRVGGTEGSQGGFPDP